MQPGRPICASSTSTTSVSTTPRRSAAGGPTSTDHADDVSAIGLGQPFQRLWQLYLCYCEAAFVERHVSDVQLILAKPRCEAISSRLPTR